MEASGVYTPGHDPRYKPDTSLRSRQLFDCFEHIRNVPIQLLITHAHGIPSYTQF